MVKYYVVAWMYPGIKLMQGILEVPVTGNWRTALDTAVKDGVFSTILKQVFEPHDDPDNPDVFDWLNAVPGDYDEAVSYFDDKGQGLCVQEVTDFVMTHPAGAMEPSPGTTLIANEQLKGLEAKARKWDDYITNTPG